MILKVRMSQESQTNLAVLKRRFFDSEDKITAGYLIGLAVDQITDSREVRWERAMEKLSAEKEGAAAKSTSLSLRQSVYQRLLDFQVVFQEKFHRKLYMSQVIALILEAAAGLAADRHAGVPGFKILEWNINGRAGYGDYVVPIRLIADEILKKAPDIFVLTEFVKSLGWRDLTAILEERYEICTTPYVPGENGILLAVAKKEGISVGDARIRNEAWSRQADSFPDFLEQDVLINGSRVKIIGTRIQVGTQKAPEEDFSHRARQFQALWHYVRTVDYPTVVIGDFNHGVIRNEGDKYYTYPPDCARCRYSYQHIWRTVEPMENGNGWTLMTPAGGDADPFSFVAKVGHAQESGQEVVKSIKEDHLIVSRGIQVKNMEYTWDFVTRKNGYRTLRAEDFKPDLGLPDHAMLVAEIAAGPVAEAGPVQAASGTGTDRKVPPKERC